MATQVVFKGPSRFQTLLLYPTIAALIMVTLIIMIGYHQLSTPIHQDASKHILTLKNTTMVEAVSGSNPKLSPSGKYIASGAIEGKTDYLQVVDSQTRELVLKFEGAGKNARYYWSHTKDILLFQILEEFGSEEARCELFLYQFDVQQKSSLGNCYEYNDQTGAVSTNLNTVFSRDDRFVLMADNISGMQASKRIRRFSIAEGQYIASVDVDFPKSSTLIGVLPSNDPSILIAIIRPPNHAPFETYRVNVDGGRPELFGKIPLRRRAGTRITSIHDHLIFMDQSDGISAINIYTGDQQQVLKAPAKTIDIIEYSGLDLLFIGVGNGFRMHFDNVAQQSTITVPKTLHSDVIRLSKIRNGALYFSAKDPFGIRQIYRSQQGRVEAVTQLSEIERIYDFDVNQQGQILLWTNKQTSFNGTPLNGNYRNIAFDTDTSMVFVDNKTNNQQQTAEWQVKRLDLKTQAIETLFSIPFEPKSMQLDGNFLYFIGNSSSMFYRWSKVKGLETLPLDVSGNFSANVLSVEGGRLLFKDKGRNMYLYDANLNQLQHIETTEQILTTYDVAYDGHNMIHLNVELLPKTGYLLSFSSAPQD